MTFNYRLLAAMALTILLAGCGTYYQVRDPSGDRSYYTTDIDRAISTGAVKFKDAKSGSVVTLQSSEVKEISKDEYVKAVAPPAAAKPAAK